MRSLIGKTELKESLRTNDLNVAKLLAPPIEDKFRDTIKAAKEGVKLSPETLQVDKRSNQLNLITGVFYRTLLKKFEESYDPRYFDAGDIREEFGLPCSDNGVGLKANLGLK